jgi:hypothetical protein
MAEEIGSALSEVLMGEASRREAGRRGTDSVSLAHSKGGK